MKYYERTEDILANPVKMERLAEERDREFHEIAKNFTVYESFAVHMEYNYFTLEFMPQGDDIILSETYKEGIHYKLLLKDAKCIYGELPEGGIKFVCASWYELSRFQDMYLLEVLGEEDEKIAITFTDVQETKETIGAMTIWETIWTSVVFIIFTSVILGVVTILGFILITFVIGMIATGSLRETLQLILETPWWKWGLFGGGLCGAGMTIITIIMELKMVFTKK